MTSDRTARNNRKAALVSLSPAYGYVHKSNSGRHSQLSAARRR